MLEVDASDPVVPTVPATAAVDVPATAAVEPRSAKKASAIAAAQNLCQNTTSEPAAAPAVKPKKVRAKASAAPTPVVVMTVTEPVVLVVHADTFFLFVYFGFLDGLKFVFGNQFVFENATASNGAGFLGELVFYPIHVFDLAAMSTATVAIINRFGIRVESEFFCTVHSEIPFDDVIHRGYYLFEGIIYRDTNTQIANT